MYVCVYIYILLGRKKRKRESWACVFIKDYSNGTFFLMFSFFLLISSLEYPPSTMVLFSYPILMNGVVFSFIPWKFCVFWSKFEKSCSLWLSQSKKFRTPRFIYNPNIFCNQKNEELKLRVMLQWWGISLQWDRPSIYSCVTSNERLQLCCCNQSVEIIYLIVGVTISSRLQLHRCR